jgi:hypothetical protein
LISDLGSAATRHDPRRWTRTLRYRDRTALPFDASRIPLQAPLLLDATVYVDALKGKLPAEVRALLAGRQVLHGAPALAELALAIGRLDPHDPRTAAAIGPIQETLARVPPVRTAVPGAACWIEAAVLAGTLARTQGIPRADRRKLQNDALLFLMAEETRAVLVSRNLRDLDLLLQMKPEVQVLLYDFEASGSPERRP